MIRILVVDDSKSARQAIEAALSSCGFEIHQAADGAAALQRLSTATYELAFVDLNMPVMDGATLVRLLRAHRNPVKVVLVTVGGATTILTGAIKQGVSEYVSKPFTLERIRVVTSRVLGLDLDRFHAGPARVLVQHPDEALAARLRELLPPGVEVDATPVFARALELAERGRPGLVLLDAAVLEGELGSAAGLVRELLPHAAVFGLASQAWPEDRWAPDGAVDGLLPTLLDEELVRDFLQPIFLRPLVFVEGAIVHAAGYDGEEAYLPAYFASLTRAILARCSAESPTVDLTIDLTRSPPDPDRIATVASTVNARLHAGGAAPGFRVAKAVRDALSARPDLGGLVLFA